MMIVMACDASSKSLWREEYTRLGVTMASDEPSPATKKIRFSEPDLEVAVGSGETRKVYMYHAVVMAIWSNYIDRMLSSDMKEGQTKKITFPDIEPSEWEAIMMYLGPGKRETPHVDEAKRLAKWFDKYEFQTGLEMCDWRYP